MLPFVECLLLAVSGPLANQRASGWCTLESSRSPDMMLTGCF